MKQPFSLTESRINLIKNSFAITKEGIEKIQNTFKRLFLDHAPHSFGSQYLAHLIRSMESILKQQTKNPLFNIIVKALPKDDPVFNVGTADYQKKRFFVVFFHPRMEAKQLRICLAHELGHLFLEEMTESHLNKIPMESVASIFGILAILEKNAFYEGKCKKYNHKNADHVIADFKQMANRRKGIMNLS